MDTKVLDSVEQTCNTPRMEDEPAGTVIIAFRVSPDQREVAEKAARYEGLTISSMVRRLLVLHLREQGFLDDAN